MSAVEGSDSNLLLAHVLEKDRAWLIAHDDADLTPEQQQRYEALLARRARGEPLAYVTGEAWFYGRAFTVTPAVLIPRPETEHLVDEALAHLCARANPEGDACVLDVGTGSGAIACTIAAELPNAVVYATERSAEALAIAERNAESLGLHPCHPEPKSCHPELVEGSAIHLMLADLVPKDDALRFDCVIANLPYIPTADLPQPPDPVSFEPRAALDGGADGLREYRRLLALLPPRLKPGALVLLEAAPPTIGALRALAEASFAGAVIGTGTDYAGLERYLRLTAFAE